MDRHGTPYHQLDNFFGDDGADDIPGKMAVIQEVTKDTGTSGMEVVSEFVSRNYDRTKPAAEQMHDFLFPELLDSFSPFLGTSKPSSTCMKQCYKMTISVQEKL